MTVQKRSRILEIIIAILMIRPILSIISDLYSYGTDGILGQNAPIFFITASTDILSIQGVYNSPG